MTLHEQSLPAPKTETGENPFAPEAFINRLYLESNKLLIGKELIANFSPQTVEDWEHSGDSMVGLHGWPIELKRARIYRGEYSDYSLVVGNRPILTSRHWERGPMDGLSFQFATLPHGNRLQELDLDYLKLMNSEHNSHGTGEVTFSTSNDLRVTSWATSHFNGSPDIRGTKTERHMTAEGFEDLMDLVADVFDRSFRKPRSILRPSSAS